MIYVADYPEVTSGRLVSRLHESAAYGNHYIPMKLSNPHLQQRTSLAGLFDGIQFQRSHEQQARLIFFVPLPKPKGL